MSGEGWGELHGPVHLTPRTSRRARHAHTEVGEGVVGVVMIAANAIGLALTGWISAGELTTVHAAPAASVPDQDLAEEQPTAALAPAAANTTAAFAPYGVRTERGLHGRACRCGPRAGSTP
ncbi:hypothetical protein [Streptomyces sp. bgisy060]|uniref:hypothetical protein n=1 Tax=Streptomyces sp. bgisy060 TaxID=3413775 RepID=UPI003EBA850A